MPRKPTIVPPRKTPTSTPARKAADIPEFDPFVDKPVRNESGTVTALTMPVRKMARLARDPGRGMMPPTGKLDPVYCGYLESLPLDELKFALAQSDTPKAICFLLALADVTRANTDITTLAKQSGIGLTEMMQIWRQHKLTTAMGVVIDGTPHIAGDIVEDAKSTLACCGRCDGAGTIRIQVEAGFEWIECVNCQGTGAVRKIGDAKSREYMLKAVGFIKPDAGVVVNTHINHTVDSVIDELDRLPPAITVSSAEISDDDA